MATAGGRLEVRLDRDRRRKLEEIAKARKVSISEMVSRIIDLAYEEELKAKRLEAADGLAGLEVEEVPDPKTLSRQLEGAYEPADLY
jgi:hypothetical protein